MRTLLASVAISLALGVGAAHAEKRMFIVPSNPDGYGVDRCLENGAACGKAVAAAYCRTRQFTAAASFRKVDRDEITGAVPNSPTGPCHAAACTDFVAIECTR
jgi:hypothetical protein